MKTKRDYSAQSMIEFTLLLPLLFLLVMGLFDIGRAIFYYAVLNSAAREGTRYAIVQPYNDNTDPYPINCVNATSTLNTSICSEITNKLFNIEDLSDCTITLNHTVSTTNDPVIIVSINFLFSPITPGIALVGDIPMQVNSQMFLTPVAIP